MEIEKWVEISQEEMENLIEPLATSIKNSLHVREVRREKDGNIYRSLYVISTGVLICHEKLKYKLNVMVKTGI